MHNRKQNMIWEKIYLAVLSSSELPKVPLIPVVTSWYSSSCAQTDVHFFLRSSLGIIVYEAPVGDHFGKRILWRYLLMARIFRGSTHSNIGTALMVGRGYNCTTLNTDNNWTQCTRYDVPIVALTPLT